ncbi:MAG: TrkH family potassium uptake protein [Clostridia bacterium]|nr:TrkH family potassium uptake protein [Clostridia bacterium]
MNYRMMLYIIGQIIRIEGLLMIIPLICSFIYPQNSLFAFLIPCLALTLLGTLMTIKRPKNKEIGAKEGFVCVALCWVVLSLLGAVPFVLSGEIPSFIDAFFETASGFTTTGSSILTEIEHINKDILMWRSLTHWIGGMGVLVFMLIFLPQADIKSSRMMHVMRAEVPGPVVGKLVSKISVTARITYAIYICLTVIEIIFLLFGKMPLYDSIVHSLGTAGTGGFSIKNTSIAYYNSAYIDYVIGIFMVLFAINFNVYFLIITGGFIKALKNEELRWFLIIVGVSTAIITLNIASTYGGLLNGLRYAFFQVSSVISTTGFSTTDFNQWPELSKAILVLLMFIGACAGSTGGGIKVSRIMLLVKNAFREIKYIIHPRAVIRVRIDNNAVEHEVIRSTTSYFIVYIIIFSFSVILLCLFDPQYDLVTNFSAVAACINNIGPGLNAVGPAANFSGLSNASKILLSFNMLAGRLELFPMLMLFSPASWKK